MLDRETVAVRGATDERSMGGAAGEISAQRRAPYQRAVGCVSLKLKCESGATRLEGLRQSSALKCFLPKTHTRAPTAVLANTAGGVAGGDHFDIRVEIGAGAAATVTTQAAERIYRSLGPPARLRASLRVDADARLRWTPEETILFDGARLDRLLEAELAADARLTAIEMIVFGRLAMGERMRAGALRDRWRIRRGGALVYADALRLDDPIDGTLARSALGGGAQAVATLVHVAPDAADALPRVRDALTTADVCVRAGASERDGVLIARFLSASPPSLRIALDAVRGAVDAAPPPQFWRR